jgi:ribosomal protein S18 acetylase RimI-like enzyme
MVTKIAEKLSDYIYDEVTNSETGVLPVGLLHYTRTKNGTELRHLAVEKDHQGRGIAAELVRHYLSITNGSSTVWVRVDNAPAVSVYKKFGYTEDGMMSDVLITK